MEVVRAKIHRLKHLKLHGAFSEKRAPPSKQHELGQTHSRRNVMRTASRLLATLSLSSVLIGPAALAAGFECGWRPTADTPAGIQDITSLLPVSDLLDHPASLNAAVDKLRKQGLSNTLIIDSLIGAFCPLVAKDTMLNDAQKTARMQNFSLKATRAVYAIESADRIFLDVPLRPDVVDAVNAKARAAGLSPQDWVAQAIGKVLAAQP